MRPKVKTLRLPRLGIIFVMGSLWRGHVATLAITRSGSVNTNLVREGHPIRSKHWTAKRDHRKRMERWELRTTSD